MNSKTYKLSSDKLWYLIESDFSNNGGIYKLSCTDNSNQIVQTNRLLKTDPKGILYIGKATSFLDRVINLKKSISPDYNSSSHECGLRYKNSDAIKKLFPYQNLVIELSAHDDINTEEKRLLTEYELEFGELPPLNRNK